MEGSWRGKTKSEILGGPAEGGPVEGGERVVRRKGGPAKGRSGERAVRRKGGPAKGRSGGRAVRWGWPPKIRQAMARIGQGNAGGQSWPKSVPPDKKRPKSASLRLLPKLERPWPKSVWPKKTWSNAHVHTTARELHASNTTKIPRKDPKREEEKKNEFCGGTGEKSAKFWAPHPANPHPANPHVNSKHTKKHEQLISKKTQTINSEKPRSSHTTETLTLPKVGLAKVSLSKVGLPKVGLPKAKVGICQSWSDKDGQSRF